MKRIVTIIAIVITMAYACGKHVQVSSVIWGLSATPAQFDADGSATATITVQIDANASADKRNVVFTSTGGSFTGGQDNKVTVAATFVDKKLVASATLKAPSSPQSITITATPETNTELGDFKQTIVVEAVKVSASTIKLEPSSFGIGKNFSTTDTLVGTLKSAAGKKVSAGAEVSIQDYLDLACTMPADGRFRQQRLSSDGTSQVRTLYSAPNLPEGTNIYIKASIKDSPGKTDIITLTIN